jgi:hypothetical protein
MTMGAGGAGTRLRPLALSDVLDETFRVYRRQFRALVTVIGVVAVPSAILSLVFVVFTGTYDFQSLQRADPTQMMTLVLAMLGIGVPLGLLYSLARLVAGAAAVRVASDAILGVQPDVGAAYREAFGRLWSLLGGSFLAGLATVLLILTCIGIPFAIYIGLGWALVLPLIMIEGLNMSAAMARSWDLVRGHRWRLLIALFLIGLITYLLVSIPSGIFGFVGGIVTTVMHAGQTGQMVVQAGNVLFGTLGETLFGSIAYIVITLFYYDLRIRKEAFDLQQRAGYADLSAGSGQSGYPGGPGSLGQTTYPGQQAYPGQDWAGSPTAPTQPTAQQPGPWTPPIANPPPPPPPPPPTVPLSPKDSQPSPPPPPPPSPDRP